MVRRALAELMAIWAGGMPQVPPATPKAWMRTSNVERRPSRPFSSRGLEAIVEIRGGCEKTVRRGGCGGDGEPQQRMSARVEHSVPKRLVLQTQPYGEEITFADAFSDICRSPEFIVLPPTRVVPCLFSG